MKLLLTLFLFVTVNIYAQFIQDFGIKIGLVNSQMSLTSEPTEFSYLLDLSLFESNRIGATFSGFLLMINNDNFNIEAELGYHEEGAQDEVVISTVERPDGIASTIWDHEYNFIRLGVNLRPKYEFSTLNLFLVVGPNINYLIKNATTFYFYEELSDFHFGYNLGIGVTFNKLLNSPLFLEIKYNGYFDDFVNNERYKVEMNSMQLNIGFMLN